VESEVTGLSGDVDAGSRMDVSDVDMPVCPGLASTTLIAPAVSACGPPRADMANATKPNMPANAAGSLTAECARGVSIADSQRMLREIDISKRLQDELAKSDHTLATAASSWDTVCSGVGKDKSSDKPKEVGVKKPTVAKCTLSDVVKPLMSPEVIEKQRATRVLVAKTMLEEELSKEEPSLALLAVLRRAAFGTEMTDKEETCEKITVATTVHECADVTILEISSKALPRTKPTAVETYLRRLKV